MNRVLGLAATLPKTCVRQISTTGVKCERPDLRKIKKKQIHFQMDNDVPVFIKGGPLDYVLYYGTIALIIVGVTASLHSTYKLATRK